MVDEEFANGIPTVAQMITYYQIRAKYEAYQQKKGKRDLTLGSTDLPALMGRY